MGDSESMDINSFCRTCSATTTESQEFISIFVSLSSSENTLPDEILLELKAFNLEIAENDGLPQQICIKCQLAFLSISQFRTQCLEVQSELLKRFRTTTKVESSTEDDCTEIEYVVIDADENINKEDVAREYETLSEDDVPNNLLEKERSKRCSRENLVKDNSNNGQKETYAIGAVEEVTDDIVSNKQYKAASPEAYTNNETTGKQMSTSDESISLIELADDDSYFCQSCKSEFNQLEAYNSHTKSCRRQYVCPVCQKSFYSASNRNTHLQLHKENTFRCDICNQSFKSKIYVAKHKKAVHETGHHVCQICGQAFNNTIKYNYHVQSHDPVKKYKCSYCERSFMQHHHLLNHERVHTGQRPYLCNICGRDFKQESNFKLHLRLHNGERPHVCNICGKDFTQRGSYVMHMRHHNNVRPYQCEVCGKNFIQMSSLRIHMRTHTGEKPYKCDHCDKAFAQTHQLKYHKYSAHNGPPCSEKKAKIIKNVAPVPSEINPTDQLSTIIEIETISEITSNTSHHQYTCPICSRGFKLPSSLTSHVKCHSEERKHVCNECGNSFKRAEHLRIHINGVHLKRKPYACDYCSKTFSQSGDRNIHMRSHAHEKPYECRWCKKGFKLQKSLRAHERIHTGERPFSCEICEMDFISYNALAIHTMKHSDEEKKSIKDKTLLEIKNSINKGENSSREREVIMDVVGENETFEVINIYNES